MGESSNSGQYQKLPPGWDCKFDQATGNCYYINYFTKAMQLEDPRIRYKQLQNERCSTESIPMQPLHGSPYHVYPSNNLPAIRAFQSGPVSHAHAGWQHMSSSPLLSSRGNLEMSPLPFPKLPVTHTPRLGNMSRRSTIQETSFSNHIDTDAVVTKIQNMFPTASENHIRLLLRRYYNREAVVISALQVEKHPVTMPGPFVTPPAQRHLFHSNSAFQMTPPTRRLDIGHSVGHSAFGIGSGTSRTASPLPGGRFGSVISMNSSGRGADGGTNGSGFVGFSGAGTFSYPATSSVLFHGSPRFGEQWRSSPKPHSSPKMKLRYMKNIFPKADEMLLLDVLAGADNNVQKASQTLISMGYAKRDFSAQKHVNHPESSTGAASDAEQQLKAVNEKIIPLRPKEFTEEEKETIQKNFKEKYSQIADRIIIMALESVNYSEDRAIQILQIVQEEENVQRAKNAPAMIAANDITAHLGMLPSTLECTENEPLTGNATCAAVSGGVDNIITVVVEETQASIDNYKNDRDQNSSSTIKPSDNSDKSNKNIFDENIKTANISTSLITTTTTSTLSTSPSSSLIRNLSKNPSKMKKLAFPSINVTTPTTATTQIILSNSPIYLEDETAVIGILPTTVETQTSVKIGNNSTDIIQIDEHDNEDKLITKSRTPEKIIPTSLSSPTSKSLSSFNLPSSFKTITVKSMLARSNDTTRRGHISSSSSSTDASANAFSTASLLEKLKITSRPRDKSDTLKHAQRDSSGDEVDNSQKQGFKSILGRIATMGPNNELNRGPDEGLLLADYVTWNGANPDISVGQKHFSVGSDPTHLNERTYVPHGRNVELCKGPKVGLAKGSIYAQLTAAKGSKSANIKCN